MTDFSVPSGQAPRKSFREVWLITIGHALTHWYPATFYLLLPPFVAGALLGYLTWRQVVVVNVIPGIAMAVLLLVLLGGMHSKPRAGSASAARAKRSFGDVLRDFRALLKNRVLIFLCASSVFR